MNSTISDRYELGDRLGSGGMSTVYRATDRILERTVAVKVLAEHLSDDDRFVARFRREALAVAKLIHPNIVQVYDTGVDDGRHFIVDRKSTRLNSSHANISYAVFCLKKKKNT